MQKRLIAPLRPAARVLDQPQTRPFDLDGYYRGRSTTEYGSQQTTSFPIDVARSGKQLLESVKINGTACTTNAALLKIDAISDGFLPRSAVLMACSLALFSLRGMGKVKGRECGRRVARAFSGQRDPVQLRALPTVSSGTNPLSIRLSPWSRIFIEIHRRIYQPTTNRRPLSLQLRATRGGQTSHVAL